MKRKKPVKRKKLHVVVDHLEPAAIELQDGSVVHVSRYALTDGAIVSVSGYVPSTRAACPTVRPCPFVRCEMNLSFVEGISRPGRRHAGSEMPATLRLEVLRGTSSSCCLDVADKGPHSSPAVAKALGLTTARRVEQITKRALAKLRAAGVDLPDPDEHRSDADRAWPSPMGYGRG